MSQPEDAEFPPILTHYSLQRVLGKGGMGLVVEGVDRRDGSRVAVKLLFPHLLAADPAFGERFEREAHVAALLRSPHTVHLLDFGAQEGRYFLVMEFIDGEPLSSLIARGPVDPDRALRIAAEVARAIEEAGARGIVHRDIKPDNILLDRQGRAKVTDFGIARSNTAPGVTVPGGFVGTPAYAAPEMIEGVSDQRSDIYAIGVTLYAMLSGRAPFAGKTDMDTLFQHRLTPVPMGPLGHLPESLQNLVRRCLEKDPLDRYQHAGELAAAIERARQAFGRLTGPIAIQPAAGGAASPLTPPPATVAVTPTPPTVAVTPAPPTVAVTPAPETVALTPTPESATPAPPTVALTPAPETVALTPRPPGATPAPPTVAATPAPATVALTPPPPPAAPAPPTVAARGTAAAAMAAATSGEGQSAPPASTGAPAGSPGGGGGGSRPIYRKPAFLAAGFLAVALAGGGLAFALLGGGDDEPTKSGEQTATATASASRTTSATGSASTSATTTATGTGTTTATGTASGGAATATATATTASQPGGGQQPAPTATPTATAPPAPTPTPTDVPPPPTATPTPPPTPTATTAATAFSRINSIVLSGNVYSVSFDVGGFPYGPNEHVHFFFNTVPASQAGTPGSGPWILYRGGSPFTGYGPGQKPAGATQMCILVANPDHSIRLGSGNCVALP